MSNELSTTTHFDPIAEIAQTQQMVAQLMKTPHYAKLGEVGVYTVVQLARSIGLNVLDALNGDMYFVQGKVELSARTMNYLIRQRGHSITKDEKSNKNICILKGKRKDNGDTWTVSFSIDDAKKAGIYKSTWEKYPEDMLFSRALTRLARQLFPDVIKGCYVEGEIRSAIEVEVSEVKAEAPKELPNLVNAEQIDHLKGLLAQCTYDYQEKIKDLLASKPIRSYEEMTVTLYKNICASAERNISEQEAKNESEREGDTESD